MPEVYAGKLNQLHSDCAYYDPEVPTLGKRLSLTAKILQELSCLQRCIWGIC